MPSFATRSRSVLSAIAGLVGAMLAPAGASALDLRHVEHPGMSVVEVRGTIEAGDTNRLQQFIGRLPQDRAIAVNLLSPGGNVEEALHMGRYFQANNIATYVRGPGARCLSACAMAFLGGRDENGATFRVKGRDAQLGYHAFRRIEDDREYTIRDMQRATAHAQDVLLKIADYFVAVDADIEFMSMMLEAPSEGMNYLANDKALTIGVHVLDERTGRIAKPVPASLVQRKR